MPRRSEGPVPGEDDGLPGVVPSPNIWRHPEVYDVENRGVDPTGALWSAMAARHDWTAQTVLDLGCGNGFHLAHIARAAARVVGVEPHLPLVTAALRRVDELDDVAVAERIEVRRGTAQELPVPDRSVDVVHARWAYFFGPGCEPGLAELDRVLRPGGTAFVVDHDAGRSTFGTWFARSLPGYDVRAVERFWRRHGWSRDPVDLQWSLSTRADFEAVIRIEFAPEHADRILTEHPGTGVDHAVNLWWRRH